jgi:hypothetical protein
MKEVHEEKGVEEGRGGVGRGCREKTYHVGGDHGMYVGNRNHCAPLSRQKVLILKKTQERARRRKRKQGPGRRPVVPWGWSPVDPHPQYSKD